MNGRIHPVDSLVYNCQAQLTSVINPFNCWDWSAKSNVHRRARQWRGYQLARILIFLVFDQHVVTSSSFPYYLPLAWIPPQLPPPPSLPSTPQQRHIHRHKCSCRHLTLPWISWATSILIKVMSSQMVIIADSEKYYLDSFHFQGRMATLKGFVWAGDCLCMCLCMISWMHFAQREWHIHDSILDSILDLWKARDDHNERIKLIKPIWKGILSRQNSL